jgi:hypothetical protein
MMFSLFRGTAFLCLMPLMDSHSVFTRYHKTRLCHIVYTRNEVSDGRSSVYSRGGHDNVGAANLDHM